MQVVLQFDALIQTMTDDVAVVIVKVILLVLVVLVIVVILVAV